MTNEIGCIKLELSDNLTTNHAIRALLIKIEHKVDTKIIIVCPKWTTRSIWVAASRTSHTWFVLHAKKENKKFPVQYGHYIFGNGGSVAAPAGVGGGAGQRPPPDHTPSVRTSVNRPTAPRFTNIMHYYSTFSPPSPATVSMLPKLHEEIIAADEP